MSEAPRKRILINHWGTSLMVLSFMEVYVLRMETHVLRLVEQRVDFAIAIFPYMTKQLPIKLNKEPLVEAICQLQIVSKAAFNTFAPGYLLAKYPDDVSDIKQLPASMLPEHIRAQAPELALAPLVSLKFKNVLVMIGERSITVANPAPYLGWAGFKPLIIEIFQSLLESKQALQVERYSLKYVNVLKATEAPNSLSALDLSINIGQLKLNKMATTVRAETLTDELVTIITLTGGVTVQTEGQAPIQGSLIDIDTICQTKAKDPEAFIATMSSELDRVRHVNKVTFFECLTEEAINELGPVFK